MATDDNYAHHLAVVIASILKNLSLERELCLYVLHDAISNGTKEKIQSLSSIRPFEINFIDVCCEQYEGLRSKWAVHVSKMSYARLNLGELLLNLEKCIYLDCDVIVRNEISELFEIDISDYFFGAVEEPEETKFNTKDMFKIPDGYGYFNAGVLLLNLKLLREHDFAHKTTSFLQENRAKLINADQDGLNALFYDKWYALPLKWNVITGMCLLGSATRYLNYGKKEVLDAVKNPAITHFTQKHKPNSFLCMHPFASEYWQYLRLTPWGGTVSLKDRTFKNIVLKFLIKLKYLVRQVPFFVEAREIKRYFLGFYR